MAKVTTAIFNKVATRESVNQKHRCFKLRNRFILKILISSLSDSESENALLNANMTAFLKFAVKQKLTMTAKHTVFSDKIV